MRVLIVDDDAALLTVYQTALSSEGYDVITAPDGQTGLNRAKVDKPDLILLDQVLPDIQGNEVLKTLKQDDETHDIPVAMLSNFGQHELIQEAINSGALDYILKYQVEPKDVIAKIKEFSTKTPSLQQPQQ